MEQQSNWHGRWIWKAPSPRAGEGEHETVYFRRTFEIGAAGDGRLLARVSADSRYRLYLNGKSVIAGPCKGDRYTHYFESVDLSEHLVQGSNVLAAQVLHYAVSEPFRIGSGGSASVWRSGTGAFLFDGLIQFMDGNETIKLHSDENWRYLEDRAIRFHPGELETLYAGGPERVDGRLLPFRWQTSEFDDSGWKKAVVVSEVRDEWFGQLTPWTLTPRPIPALYETHRGFARVTRAIGGQSEPSFQAYSLEPHEEGYPVGAGETVIVELDAGELVTGFPFLELEGGGGAEVKLLYSECYEAPSALAGTRNKGVRDDADNGCLIGEQDIYIAAGIGGRDNAPPERYEPFSFRTFRFVRLEVNAGAEPLLLRRFNFRETGYPIEADAEFASSDPTLAPLWDISIRTLKRCMHETYEDCPYYEQLQYILDTRLQALFTYHLSADDRLARKAIFDFHSSLLPNGMLQSRYPSVSPQVIPGYSVHWIFMIGDHYRYFADLALVRRYLPTIDAVLGWFERHLTSEGLVGQVPAGYWPFVDWVDEWRGSRGVPDAHRQGPLTVYSLLYAAALETAAELNDEAVRTATADEYRRRARLIKQAAIRYCWSAKKRLFQDGPGIESYSQHTQVWAVISGTLQGEEAETLMDTMLAKPEMPRVSYAMSFFLFRALSMTGRYDQAFRLWDVWRKLADLNLTTWVEDPVSQRSDCHAWGAVPIYEFAAEILGVKPDGCGFDKALVEPRTGELSWAKGGVATPKGLVRVEWELKPNRQFRLYVDAPPGMSVTCKLPDGQRIECQGPGPYVISAELRQGRAGSRSERNSAEEREDGIDPGTGEKRARRP